MRESQEHRTTGALGCVAAMLCFGSVPVFLRYFTGWLDPFTVNGVRYATAAVFWLPTVIFLHRRRSRATDGPGGAGERAGRSVWRDALIPTVVNLAGQVGWGLSPYFVQATTIGFVIRSSFLFTVLLGFLFIPRERLLAKKPLFVLGAAACIGGVVVMFLQRLSGTAPAPTVWGGGLGGRVLGMGILVATALCWGAYAVSIRRCMGGYPLRLAFGVISLYTAGGLVVLMLIFGQYRRLAELSPRMWGLLIASAFVGIAFAHILYYRGIHGLGPVVASGITMASPFVTYLFAVAFLGERLTAGQFAGGLAVVAGGVLLVGARAGMPDGTSPPR